MNAHDAIIRYLEAEGVDTVFSLMSEDTKRILSKMRADSDAIDVVEARHEQHAAAMADGYARTSDGLGVCVLGRGPGVAQTGTALGTSNRRGSRMLVLVPASPLSSEYDVKAFDQDGYLTAMFDDDNVVTVGSHRTLLPEFRDVFRRLWLGEGPIAVQVPWDLLDDEFAAVEAVDDWIADAVAARRTNGPPGRLDPDEAAVEEAVDLYLDSDASVPPLIIAGRGAVRADAREAIESLAERMGAMLATTLQGQGFFSEHPYSVGFVGDFGRDVANRYASESDFVLAVGCSLNPHTMDEGRLLDEDATVVHVDTDPGSFGRYTPVDLGIQGDARRTVAAMEEAVEAAGIDVGEKFWTERRRTRIAESSALDDREFSSAADRMDPRDVVRFLDRTVAEDRRVVVDGGHFTNWVLDGIAVSHPDSFVWTLDFAAVGQGLPIGVGAAVATPDRPTLAVCGDAGFMMTPSTIDTAARNDVPLVVVVINDGALGSEYHQLERIDEHSAAALVDSPDIAAVAEGLGAESHTVRSLEDLEDIDAAFGADRDGPLVVDCRVNHAVRHRAYDQMFME